MKIKDKVIFKSDKRQKNPVSYEVIKIASESNRCLLMCVQNVKWYEWADVEDLEVQYGTDKI
jgi:hypothetical protein